MRLVVKRDSQVINEFQFAGGPIHIGRHTDSQVFLSDKTVSRHHAVIFSTDAGKWMVEDLSSANKTYLNDKETQKAEIKTGDKIRINNFIIEVNLEDETIADKPINLEDTLTTASPSAGETRSALEARIITRRINAGHGPDINLPVTRVKDFMQATEAICRTNTLEEMLKVLLNISSTQFSAYHTWCALRSEPSGDMTCHAGKKRGGGKVELQEIKLGEKITQAMEKKQFLLLPRIPPQEREKEPVHSALIAPIVNPEGCFGVLYLDNDMSHESYSLSDLDYLMMVAIHTAVVLENF